MHTQDATDASPRSTDRAAGDVPHLIIRPSRFQHVLGCIWILQGSMYLLDGGNWFGKTFMAIGLLWLLIHLTMSITVTSDLVVLRQLFRQTLFNSDDVLASSTARRRWLVAGRMFSPGFLVRAELVQESVLQLRGQPIDPDRSSEPPLHGRVRSGLF